MKHSCARLRRTEQASDRQAGRWTAPYERASPMRIEDFRRAGDGDAVLDNPRGGQTDTVGSPLIGEQVDLRLYAETIEVWRGELPVATMHRQRGRGNVSRQVSGFGPWLGGLEEVRALALSRRTALKRKMPPRRLGQQALRAVPGGWQTGTKFELRCSREMVAEGMRNVRTGWANKRRRPCRLAGRQGVEPRFTGPEPVVLPLNDLPASAGRWMLHGG